MTQTDKKHIQDLLNQNNNIIAMYDYGSTVYGTRSEKSDNDVIMVVNDKDKDHLQQELSAWFDVNVYSHQEFTELIKKHEITALECLALPESNIWKKPEQDWQFELNLPELRQSLSAKSSNSWVKAKKKFIVEQDYAPYIGQKSAWHAIRIMEFGYQIATQGKIENFAAVNHLLPQIMKCNSWQEIDDQFRKTCNEYSSRFRQVAPKELPVQNSNAKPKIK
jgi:predicted nucleotidyltransferase